jgi:hypothetical protein
VDDPQPEYFLECIEVAVAMQQFVIRMETESSDKTVNGPSDGLTTVPQGLVVLGRSNGQLLAACFQEEKAPE